MEPHPPSQQPLLQPSQQQRLLARLEAIGQALAQSGRALALIGLGSVGLELERLDAHSDLDFFAIVEAGQKASFLADLGWLTQLGPVAFHFQNTPDGFKLLFADDVFCEFAVFEPAELAGIPFTPGRIVWKRDGVDDAIAAPRLALPQASRHDPAWLLGEALTNLYIGLGRFYRGEKLSALRFVQHYALDHLLKLAAQIERTQPALADPFNFERRFENRFPQMAALLPQLAQGYERTPESALAILEVLETHFAVAPAMAAAIRRKVVGQAEKQP
jgi:hypothetical protein